jgi:hypothetical protein
MLLVLNTALGGEVTVSTWKYLGESMNGRLDRVSGSETQLDRVIISYVLQHQ